MDYHQEQHIPQSHLQAILVDTYAQQEILHCELVSSRVNAKSFNNILPESFSIFNQTSCFRNGRYNLLLFIRRNSVHSNVKKQQQCLLLGCCVVEVTSIATCCEDEGQRFSPTHLRSYVYFVSISHHVGFYQQIECLDCLYNHPTFLQSHSQCYL